MKFVYLMSAVVVACGLVGFGCFSAKRFRANQELIEVRGLSEKIVRADVGDLTVRVTNKNAKLDELHKKRMADRELVLEFLKKNGVTDDEILEVSIDTRDSQDDDHCHHRNQDTAAERYYIAEDKFHIRTKKIEKIERLKSDIVSLLSENVLVCCDYSYSLTNFIDLKLDMMREASETAKKNAEEFIRPQHRKLGDIVFLRQGDISIRAENEDEAKESWNSQESKSINKKLRLVVRAGFSKKCEYCL
ncbi:MAG: SIMPL domain-containing protein [Holosporaceae bacterium]|nr:SIMPL domain-containing protein [Holosporaceae bacterium]